MTASAIVLLHISSFALGFSLGWYAGKLRAKQLAHEEAAIREAIMLATATSIKKTLDSVRDRQVAQLTDTRWWS